MCASGWAQFSPRFLSVAVFASWYTGWSQIARRTYSSHVPREYCRCEMALSRRGEIQLLSSSVEARQSQAAFARRTQHAARLPPWPADPRTGAWWTRSASHSRRESMRVLNHHSPQRGRDVEWLRQSLAVMGSKRKMGVPPLAKAAESSTTAYECVSPRPSLLHCITASQLHCFIASYLGRFQSVSQSKGARREASITPVPSFPVHPSSCAPPHPPFLAMPWKGIWL
jgi:hypothetical protein